MTLKNFLIKNKACSKGLEYAKNMTLYEFYHNCNRGDWLIWLFSKTNANDSKAVVLVAAHCANACRHFLEDERSLKAIEAAMNSESYSEVQLYEIYDAAADAANAADAAYYAARAARYAANAARAARYAADAAYAAARAARYAACAAYYAADAAYAACAAYYAACAGAAAARTARALRDNKLIADIVRKHLPLEIWNQKIINL